MLILALDTSSAAGSAAIVRDGEVLLEREGNGARTHGERLPLELMQILREAAITLAEIDRFAVVTGPGSFTGLRVGIATMQGLALAHKKTVSPVSAFEASMSSLKAGAAYSVQSTHSVESTYTAVWIDAHRREVFGALYGADGTAVAPPTALSPDATIDAWVKTIDSGSRLRFAGDGAVRYADVIRARLGERAVLPESVPPLAGAAGLIAAADPSRAVVPHAVVPLYVRRSDAELARDRARAAQHS